MMSVRPRLSYANVVATLALFLTLTGGAVWAASKISGKQIKKNSIPGNRIKKKTLTNDRIKKKTLTNDRIKPGTIQRTALAAGALPGLTVADASASNLPGATTKTPPGPTPVALTGNASFTPVGGKSYLLQAELVGNPVAVNPDRELARIAREREWEVRYFQRPVRLRDRVPVPPKGPTLAAGGVAIVAGAAVGVYVWLRRRSLSQP